MSAGLVRSKLSAVDATAAHSATAASDIRTIGFAIGLAFACSYILRMSVLSYLLSSSTVEMMSSAVIITLLFSSAYIVGGGIGTVNGPALLFLVATGVSLVRCEHFAESFFRWVGWTLLVLSVGPIIYTRHAWNFRYRLMQMMQWLLIGVVMLSAAWWVAGLPNLGRGDFTGVMNHSMVLGPIAAFVGVVAFIKALTRGQPLWLLLCPVATVVALLASSRSALAAMAVGILIAIALRIAKHPLISTTVVALAMILCIAPTTSLNALATVMPGEFTKGLAKKSWNNSREYHWYARWDEFLSSPVTGIGFAAAWEGTPGFDEETGAVETGSSYISVLSMTGVVGVATFLLLVGSLGWRFLSSWSRLSEQRRVEHGAMAGFWLVHLGAQGYIYAVSSMMGLLLWLWVGCLDNELRELHRRPATPSQRTPMARVSAFGVKRVARAASGNSRTLSNTTVS